MSNPSIDFTPRLDIPEVAQLIATNKSAIFLVRGEKGIGKSYLPSEVQKLLPEYGVAMIPMASLDVGDLALPALNHEKRTTDYYINSAFGLTEGKPMIICIDEFTKGLQPAQNAVHQMLERKNRRIGSFLLKPEDIVMMNGNLSVEGLGDTLKDHTRDRVTEVELKKPGAEATIAWMVANNKNPLIPAFIRAFPQALASFRDGGQESNPYIGQPKKVQGAVVTNRSLDRAGDFLDTRHLNTYNGTKAALIGTIGAAAANDMMAFVDYQDQLPEWDAVISNPQGTRLPDSAGAMSIMVFGAISVMDSNNLTAIMTYIERLGKEWQGVFAITASRSPKQSIAYRNPKFTQWVQENNDLL